MLARLDQIGNRGQYQLEDGTTVVKGLGEMRTFFLLSRSAT